MKKLFSVLTIIIFLFSCGKMESAITKPVTSFEKIIFHTTGCFGFCPTYHLEVKNTKDFKFFAEKVYKTDTGRPFTDDSVKMGYFKGVVTDSLFSHLDQELKTIGLDTLDFDGPDCCDGSTTTLIVYYKGKRKELRAMFPPQEANKLISILKDICEKSTLIPSSEEFVIENIKERHDED